MIKLCRLGEFLSFDELIRKIQGLERRLSSTSPAVETPPAAQVSDPAVDWEEENPPKGDDWDGFLGYITPRNRAMANVLKELPFVGMTHAA